MKRLLVILVLPSLACAGATEESLELSIGGELSEEHGAVVVTPVEAGPHEEPR